MTLGRGPWLSALGLTGLAAALRFAKLGTWSLWIDEGNTLWLTQYLSGKRPTDAYPLFFWLERKMVDALGTGEFALRLLPALLGVLSVPLLYLLFRRPAGERAARWAAFLMALSPWHLFWSQNARYYTLLLVIALLLYRLAWDWWEQGGRLRLYGLIGLGGLGLLTQFTLALAWPALVAYPLIARRLGGAREGRFAWRRVLLFTGVLALPVLAALGRLLSFSDRFVDLPRHYGDSPFVLLAGLGYHLSLPLVIAILAGIWSGRTQRDRQRRRFTLFLAIGGLGPVAVAAALTFKIIATNYYVFFALPFFLLLAGLALSESRERRHFNLLAGLLLAAVSVQRLALYYTAQHGDRIRWREAVAYIQRERLPGDRIISSGSEAVSYYLGETPALLNATDRQTMIQWELKPEWRQPTGRTWYLVNDELMAQLDHDGAFRRFLSEECDARKELPAWTGPKNRTARVYLWTPPASAP